MMYMYMYMMAPPKIGGGGCVALTPGAISGGRVVLPLPTCLGREVLPLLGSLALVVGLRSMFQWLWVTVLLPGHLGRLLGCLK